MNKPNYYRLKKEGKCTKCSKNRGEDGTKTMCRFCADKMQENQLRKRKQKKTQGLCVHCGRKAVSKIYCEECRRRTVISQAKQRAKKAGVLFDLKVEDVEWVEVCPVLGIPLDRSIQDNKPSLDRFIPDKGYVKGNVHIISMKANVIKSNATIEEIQRVLDWMKGQSD